MNEQRISVVTGATGGIGYETALALAKMGDRVILLNRNEEKSKHAVDQIQEATRHEQVDYVIADLASLASVRAAAAEIKNRLERLDVLINNAGTWFSKQTLTEDGIEMQLAVNHVAPFLLTHLLLPLLLQSEDGRIINVSSDTHARGRIRLDDLEFKKGYHGIKSYGRSKLAMVQCTYELSERLEGTNVTVNAVQPGLVKTDIGHKATIGLHSVAWWFRKLGGVPPEKGAETNIYLATSPEAKGVSGKYWDKCQPKPSSKRSYDRDMQKKIWEVSMDMAGIENYIPEQ